MQGSIVRACALMLFVAPALFAAQSALAAVLPGAVPTGQLPAAAAPTHYKLDLTIRPKLASFSGTVAIDITLKEPARFLYLHGKELNVTQAELVSRTQSEIVTYAQVSPTGVARIDFGREVPAGAITLRVAFNAPYNDGLDGLYRASDSGNWYAFSQFEAISARYLFPCFDQPGFKTPFDITVTAEQTDAVIANTPAAKIQMLPGGLKRVTFATTEPLPTYLLAFAVGPLDMVRGPDIPATKLRARPIPLGGVAVKGKGPQLAIALEETPAIVTILEDYFAIPYPYAKLDLIAAADFAAGAMENAGAIAYRETRVLLEPNAPISQMREFELVHAHELAHQWFGDLVTPRWWDDIWLNEAFATWMGNKLAAVWQPNGSYERQTIYRASDTMNEDALAHARRIHEPVADEDGIASAFDGITYQKGCAGVHESDVRELSRARGLPQRARAKSPDALPALASHLAAVFSRSRKGSGRPEIVPAFQTFLDQPGLPLVEQAPGARKNCGQRSPFRSATTSRSAASPTSRAAGNGRSPFAFASQAATQPARSSRRRSKT
ncbi:MAG: M1 family metallopeptidase [Alphaproteobacteria bacterium]